MTFTCLFCMPWAGQNWRMRKVFTELPFIVNIEVLEAVKEDIQSLALAWCVITLSTILTTPLAQSNTHLELACKRHRLNGSPAMFACMRVTMTGDAMDDSRSPGILHFCYQEQRHSCQWQMAVRPHTSLPVHHSNVRCV
ncbi:hypothetical protein J3R82DRAFT_3371 [Butyriboletus roseoflavus]|nr:hypothetical protein J3R82DRAFT_3371 [Butyriboletus roseoflavus]